MVSGYTHELFTGWTKWQVLKLLLKSTASDVVKWRTNVKFLFTNRDHRQSRFQTCFIDVQLLISNDSQSVSVLTRQERLSVCPSVRLSVSLPVCLSVRPAVRLPACLSVPPSPSIHCLACLLYIQPAWHHQSITMPSPCFKMCVLYWYFWQ